MGRLLFFVALAIILYAAIVMARNNRGERRSREERREGRRKNDPTPMVRCPVCGTYFPEGDAVLGDGRRYCSERCRARAREDSDSAS